MSITECPICRCRMTIPPGYSRSMISCGNGHPIALERPRRRFRPAPELVIAGILLALALAATAWPRHLGVLPPFGG